MTRDSDCKTNDRIIGGYETSAAACIPEEGLWLRKGSRRARELRCDLRASFYRDDRRDRRELRAISPRPPVPPYLRASARCALRSELRLVADAQRLPRPSENEDAPMRYPESAGPAWS